jgi:hypothetical protein
MDRPRQMPVFLKIWDADASGFRTSSRLDGWR